MGKRKRENNTGANHPHTNIEMPKEDPNSSPDTSPSKLSTNKSKTCYAILDPTASPSRHAGILGFIITSMFRDKMIRSKLALTTVCPNMIRSTRDFSSIIDGGHKIDGEEDGGVVLYAYVKFESNSLESVLAIGEVEGVIKVVGKREIVEKGIEKARKRFLRGDKEE